MMHFLSIVIPTFNNATSLKFTLKSFSHQTFKNFEVVIADDGSSDGTKELIKENKWSFPIQYHYQENKGRSAARNLGWKNAKGNIIIFIDDHALLDKFFLEEHYKTHLENDSSPFAVVRGFAPRIGDMSNAGKKILSPSKKEKAWLFKHEQDPFRTFCTNNISIRKKVLEEIGGFDEDFTEYGFQDAEIGWRIKKAGYRFKINVKAVAAIFSQKLGLIKRCDKMRQAGHSAVLFKKKHPLLGIQLVNIFSTFPYTLYSALDYYFLKKQFKKLKETQNKIPLENKLRYFFHSLGIKEARSKKKKFPSTEDFFKLYA